MAATIEGRDRELIEQPNFCMVATLRPDGTPHVTPTWVDYDGEHILLNSAEGRSWPENIRRDSRVTLTILNMENPYEYLSIRGRLADDTHEGAREQINRLAKKYMDKDEYPGPADEVRVIFKIEPLEVRRFGS
ncbi:MAG TPA: PPOX class F420-dependent oxidoreductase [Solirubrobacteraceae bacterium]|nr:PPOX class F420-dependent oxidoreductase [Solirubrobacteraceae bacterium]